jgi:hypothetical protein
MNPKYPLPHIPCHDQFLLEVVLEGFDLGFVVFYKVPIEKHGKLGVCVWLVEVQDDN